MIIIYIEEQLKLTSLSPSVSVLDVHVFASLCEPEKTRNVETFVLRVVAPGISALRYANFEIPSLFEEAFELLVRPLTWRRGFLRRVGTVIVCQLGYLRDVHRRRRWRCHRLPIGQKITLELIKVIGIDEIEQALTQQFILRNTISEVQMRESNSEV